MSDSTSQLVAVLGMLGSQFDGECLNAARMAEKMRRKMDKTWQQLLTAGASSPKDELGWLARALRAEKMVSDLTARIGKMEAELAELRKARPSASASSTGPRPRSPGYKYSLSAETEQILIDKMLLIERSTNEIYYITKWPRAHLRVVLERIAHRRKLELHVRRRFGSTFYRFTRV
jgi:hypothetical protein